VWLNQQLVLQLVHTASLTSAGHGEHCVVGG
jgi:hypothetical protein